MTNSALPGWSAEKARRRENSKRVRERIEADTDNGRAHFDALRERSGLVDRLVEHLRDVGLEAEAKRLAAAPNDVTYWDLAEKAEERIERKRLAEQASVSACLLSWIGGSA